MLGDTVNKVTNYLYIGGVFSFSTPNLFKDIDVVIKLYNGKYGKYPEIPSSLKVYDFPAVDGGRWTEEYFNEVLKTIHSEILQRRTVYVSCAAGKSRSATIVLAYLVKYKHMELKDAWNLLKKVRPVVNPSFYLLLSLVEYLEVHPYLHTLVE